MKKVIAACALLGTLSMPVAAGAAINVNTASGDRLTDLNGVGPVTAAKIVADRKANGQYKSLDALTRVNGIGAKTVADLRDNASVGDSQKKPTSD